MTRLGKMGRWPREMGEELNARRAQNVPGEFQERKLGEAPINLSATESNPIKPNQTELNLPGAKIGLPVAK
jgi:hypothetical protein